MAGRQGPLADLRVVELAGIGAAPFGAMLLADLGADVIRIDRAPGGDANPLSEVLGRGRRSVALDLKHRAGVEVVLRLVEQADALIEGFRPGVMERLGLGPDVCLARNERLVYGRMTGWGQDGPLARQAGHDIDYIAVSGALGAIGRRGESPVPPLNLVGDFGGGGMLLAFGIVSAVLEARSSGRGQVVDAAMVDGSALLLTMVYEARNLGLWTLERGTNLLDGGAPFYDVYATSDGGAMAVGCLEPAFYAELLRVLELDRPELRDHTDPDSLAGHPGGADGGVREPDPRRVGGGVRRLGRVRRARPRPRRGALAPPRPGAAGVLRDRRPARCRCRPRGSTGRRPRSPALRRARVRTRARRSRTGASRRRRSRRSATRASRTRPQATDAPARPGARPWTSVLSPGEARVRRAVSLRPRSPARGR